MDKIEFGQWIAQEREKRGWSQSDLARNAGLHRQSLYKIEIGDASPAVETYIALASALGLSPILLFRKAGLLPPALGNESDFDDWKYLLAQLPPDEQEEMRKIAQMKIEKRQAAEAAGRAGQFKPGKQPK